MCEVCVCQNCMCVTIHAYVLSFSTPTTRNSWENVGMRKLPQKGAAAPGGAVTRATDLVVTWPDSIRKTGEATRPPPTVTTAPKPVGVRHLVRDRARGAATDAGHPLRTNTSLKTKAKRAVARSHHTHQWDSLTTGRRLFTGPRIRQVPVPQHSPGGRAKKRPDRAPTCKGSAPKS